MIVFENVSKAFPSSGSVICSNYSQKFNRGSVYGVYGPNGVGKSTLMRLMIGSIIPDRGSVSVRGKVVPFLQLGVAFHFELTAKDNLYVNGLIMNIELSKLRQIENDVFDFAGLTAYKDIRLKHFSSGMVSKLAFSIAKFVEGDIYIYDEILAVGDREFSTKCWDIFRDHKLKNRLTIVVSHDLNMLEEICDEILMMAKGEQGNPMLVSC